MMSSDLETRFGAGPAYDGGTPPLWPQLAGRGSVRAFADTPVDPAMIETLAALALCAPTKSDLQQRDIVILRDPAQRERMGQSGRERAVQYGWENITAKVEDYYGFVIRRLEARNALPSGFSAPIPEAPSRTPGLWSKTEAMRTAELKAAAEAAREADAEPEVPSEV